MDFSIILTEWPTYWEGFYTTIWLVAQEAVSLNAATASISGR